MELEKKVKLLNYIMPNDAIRIFLCNDLFIELKKKIAVSLCISTKNNNDHNRKNNLEVIKNIIEVFINENNAYKNQIRILFNEDEHKLLEHIVIGYVFYIINTIPKYNHVDIFKDKRSVCYSPISIIDFI